MRIATARPLFIMRLVRPSPCVFLAANIGDERLMPHRIIKGLAVASLAPYLHGHNLEKFVNDTVTRRVALKLALAALAAGIAPFPAFGQNKYPERPIRLIVPRPAGGVVDIVGRQWAERVRTSLGSVFIENVGGGGGTIGTSAAAHASPDGYTLVIGSTSDLVLNPVIMPNLTYDAAKDFAPVSIMAISVGAIIVNASLPVKTLPELVAFAKANPGKLSYGSAGAGTMANLTGELFKQLAGLPEIVHIPYKGAAPSLADLVAGHIPMVAATISNAAIELHKSGKVRIWWQPQTSALRLCRTCQPALKQAIQVSLRSYSWACLRQRVRQSRLSINLRKQPRKRWPTKTFSPS